MIKENIVNFKKSIPKHVTLVAVSKTKPISDLQEAYNAGQRVFGENKVQEMIEKYDALPKDIQWHMIGHLQSNKVKYMAHFVDLIHGVDSFKTLQEINKQALKNNRIIKCLLQAEIANEETKFGLPFDEIYGILFSEELTKLKNISIVGLMGMATFTEDKQQISTEFASLKKLFEELKNTHPSFKILSMGMSGDYEIAIENGSTMIRVGSAIFGQRNYIL
ncbi:MAG: YggS family pyridoxal phosphate-dependent enzyme [Flavobacteriia bacterium]|nr:YggS family pyridoxal phosphate-dependent enzyme [Flavobacteriia bacterium]OIP45202.1 MAG: YggS family pyridoxal phosphate enzyme [Flavobacteriaceae bacterium CG2_30_31_66]PIV97548.1 MAG: YggS family pyridoxal phosphate-dependent enzyme [Flavobacteriaceae bacterium CG17_big_fil_post_rev_8_21_14_2_50_31_13]PIY14666.1 MAG: YggS family pyridoxal phosphate-dependent enzyme [Flavobacteriaceae bacterium CG_4_10_14_3_um_filter_31_253]PIZ10102.1 MAG: YggS family pyridoxal phosphate-dependent enzyme 